MRNPLLDGFHPPATDWVSLGPVLPILVVMVTGIVGLLIEMARPKRNNNFIVAISLIGLAGAGVLLANQLGEPRASALADMVLRDGLGVVLQLLMVGSALVATLFSEGYLREKRIPFGEFYPLMLWSLSGGMLMVATTNLLMLFLGLEVLSISLYVMAGLSRGESKSEESALKYFLLGAFASAFLLYGMAFLYGASGSLELDAIAGAWKSSDGTLQPLVLFGLGLMLVGFSFKAAFVPFHQWTPDVYQGAPTNVTAFMAAISKIAAIGALYRVLDASLPLSDIVTPVLFWLAILTMTVGNLIALVQTDLKRILAYSSIGHAGYLLVGLIAHYKNPTEVGFGSVTYYLFAYAGMTLGAFAVISLIAKSGREGTLVRDLNGLWRRSPGLAVAMVLFMASLIGIPFTSGFLGKLNIISDAVGSGLTSLAVVLVVNSVISVYYYLGIAMAAFVNDESDSKRPLATPNFGLTLATSICVAVVIGGFVMASPILKWTSGEGPSYEVQAPQAPKTAQAFDSGSSRL